MTTLAAALAAVTSRLAWAGIEAPRREAVLLMGIATGLGRAEQLAHDRLVLGPEEAERLERLVERRVAREPYAYLAGQREFYGRPFLVGPGVLVPRPDTETLVEAVLAARPDRAEPLRILDLGVGSGCILLTLLAEYQNATGIGVDPSKAALDFARRNARALGVAGRARLVQGSWGSAIGGSFELIVSNPPYIDAADLAGLEPELAFEPAGALSPGADGTQSYRAMTPDLLRLLAPGGRVALEIGRGQEVGLTSWFQEHGFAVELRPDLAGIARCLVLARQDAPDR